MMVFNRHLDSFVVSDSTLIAEILRSRAFAVVDYARHYGDIADRTGLDFDAAVRAMRHMPLANEGEPHRLSRTRCARAISDNWAEHAGRMENSVAELARVSFRVGALDLVGQFAMPIFKRLFLLWSGLSLEHDPEISQVFCGRLSLNRRMHINARLRSLEADLYGGTPPIPADVALSFAILASDSLVGSLSLSLWTVFSANDGSRICDIPFPEALPSTAVPYVDRIANEDIVLCGCGFRKGQRVRLTLKATAHEGSDNNLFFGAGRHICVGKAMTNLIWNSIARALAPVELRVETVSLVMRRPDHVFHYPQSAMVRLHA